MAEKEFPPSQLPKSIDVELTNPTATVHENTGVGKKIESISSVTPPRYSERVDVKAGLLSPAASSGPRCRICHEGDHSEDLVSLCNCAGTIGLVHVPCLERWLSTRNGSEDKCEICEYSFETTRSPKSVGQWCLEDKENLEKLVLDVIWFILLSALSITGVYGTFEAAKQEVMWNRNLKSGFLMALATFFITLYVFWVVVIFRYHMESYLKFRSSNRNVKLLRFRKTDFKLTDSNLTSVVVVNSPGTPRTLLASVSTAEMFNADELQ